jgi:uncharacterized protein YhaN
MFTIFFGLFLAVQSRKINSQNLRQIANELRHELNYCHVEQERLHRTLNRMDSKVDQLHRVEQELGQYCNTGPTQLRALRNMVREQSVLTNKMTKIIQQNLLQTIMRVVVTSDHNGDFAMTSNELEALILGLKALPGVKLNETNFRAKMAEGDRSLRSIMELIRDFLADHRNDVFELVPKELIQPKQPNLLLDI